MSNKIYVVAGERNMKLARSAGSGLWANVGQTSRQVSDRLRDDDYKRKAAGGTWQVLLEQEVGDLSDKEIHPLLKSHPRVLWENSNNTEEFLFLDDTGDGAEACRIVSEILSSRCIPLLKAENERLQKEIVALQTQLTIVDDVIGPTGVNIEKLIYAHRRHEGLQKSTRLAAALAQSQKERGDRLAQELSGALSEKSILKNSLESKIKNQKLIFGLLAVALFLIGSFLRYQSHIEELAKVNQEFGSAAQSLATANAQLKELQAKMDAIQSSKDEKTAKSKNRSLKKKAMQEEGLRGGDRPKLADLADFESCIYKANTAHERIDFIMKCNIGNEVEMKKCLMTDEFAGAGIAELSTASSCWKKTHF